MLFTRLLSLLLLLLMVASTLAEDKAVDPAAAAKEAHKKEEQQPDARRREHDDADDDDDDDDDREDHGRKDDSDDHEAFLGHDESHRFDDLTPKQAQNALLEMLPRIDANADGNVTEAEMQSYLAAVAKRERRLKSDKRFDEIKLFNHALDVNAPMTFDEYKHALQQSIVGARREGDKKAMEEFNNQVVRSQARWAKADLDGDKALSKAEFGAFLRPEEAPHMRDIVIQETMMNSDKNKDGKIDLNEYMTELRPTYEADVKNKKRMPRWVEKEEKRFKEKLDINKDGALDPNEVYQWVVPEDFDHSRKETAHMFKLADQNNDKQLTREEILNKWKTFVGHRGDDDRYSHDEL